MQIESENRMLRCAERLNLPIVDGIVRSLETQVDKEPVISVSGRRENRFLCDWYEAGSLLARALGKKLFHP